jgi:ferrous iron transport protein B
MPGTDFKSQLNSTGLPTVKQTYTLALAGNANVGKSAIFNQLTGLVQETGNWAGKTVLLKEGTLQHDGISFKIVDLPGVYSFASFSPDEKTSRDFILQNKPDAIINVLDATSLERNLYYTLELKEMGVPCVIALNYTDVALKRHIHTDPAELSRILGYPVINTVAIKGIGVHELVDAAYKLIVNRENYPAADIRYGAEIENRIEKLSLVVAETGYAAPARWTAIKLLEKDLDVIGDISWLKPEIIPEAEKLAGELLSIHGEDSSTVIASERYAAAAQINRQISRISTSDYKAGNTFDNIAMHPAGGYVVFIATMAVILIIVSLFGAWMSNLITGVFESFNPHTQNPLGMILWNGGVTGLYAALSVAIGFILPFYIILSWLGESGYLPRIAFMLDRPCHTLGLHGQASLPLIMGFGCNVPACLSCRIMGNKRDRLIATFLTTLIPCSARSSIVLGLVGAFVGWQWAICLYLFQFLLIYAIGKILNRISPNKSPGIIMEIPDYHMPSLKIVWTQAWSRFKDFLTLGIPLIVAGSMVIEALQVFHWLDYVTRLLQPVTVLWLGLPAYTGVILIIGILRKEANLALLIAISGGAAISTIMTPVQMVVFTIVILLYVPCISTIAVLFKETGLKYTVIMVLSEIVLAVLVGGIASRVLPFVLQT